MPYQTCGAKLEPLGVGGCVPPDLLRGCRLRACCVGRGRRGAVARAKGEVERAGRLPGAGWRARGPRTGLRFTPDTEATGTRTQGSTPVNAADAMVRWGGRNRGRL